MTDTLRMTAKEAIEYVADHYNVPSMYALAKSLSDEKLTVQPIQISNYIRGRKMKKAIADRFREVYDIEITDVFGDPNWAKGSSDGKLY